MKKLCLVSVVLVFLLISGCNNPQKPLKKSISPPDQYSVNLDVTFRNINMTALMTKHSPEKFEIKMLSPEILTPLSLIYENGICTVTYDGLTFESDFNRFPQSEFAALLTRALNDVDSGISVSESTENGDIIFKGITDYGEFALTQDSETGLWKEFTVNGASLHVIFSAYKTN